MTNQILIGLALGLISAVVFASATTGPLIARYGLFLITPLPIFLAGLGWGPATAVIAGVGGALLVGLATAPVVALAFAATQVLPAVVLTTLAQRGRTEAAGQTDWFPAGHIVLLAALIAGSLALFYLVFLGGDLEHLKTSLRAYIGTMVKTELPEAPDGSTLSDTDIGTLTDIAIAALPAASALSWMIALLFNLWLAGRVTLASGQLRRPWPDLAAITYPSGTSLLFLAALLGTASGGTFGMAATGFAGAFFAAYALLGLAVLHHVTRGYSWRPFALWALYVAVLFVNVWVAVALAIVGLADGMLHFRRARPPPTT